MGESVLKHKGWNLIRRCLVLCAGLFVMSLGVAFSVRANLGTAPVSSLPYVLSLRWASPSLGVWTAIVNGALIVLQIILMRRRYEWIQLLQLPVTLLFGLFVDLSSWLTPWLQPDNYALRWVCVLIGCVLIGIGVSMQVQADVIMMPGEGTVKVFTILTGGEFGKVKVLFDVSMVALSTAASLILFQGLRGVREGTLAAALLIGLIVRFINQRVHIFKPKTGEEQA